MELFYETIYLSNGYNYLREKAPSQMFDWVEDAWFDKRCRYYQIL